VSGGDSGRGRRSLRQLDLVTFPSLICATFRLCWQSKREGWGTRSRFLVWVINGNDITVMRHSI
jgi:hypothetical protein